MPKNVRGDNGKVTGTLVSFSQNDLENKDRTILSKFETETSGFFTNNDRNEYVLLFNFLNLTGPFRIVFTNPSIININPLSGDVLSFKIKELSKHSYRLSGIVIQENYKWYVVADMENSIRENYLF